MKKVTNISKYNKIIQEKQHLPENVWIFDTTLRDGEQTPGVSITNDEKITIAAQLDKLGVRVIEAGFPANSKAEKHTIKEISKIGFKSDICGLARVIKNDIDACIDCDVDIIHTFASTSDLHLKYQINKTREEVKEIVVKAVEYIKEHGFQCLFSPMDATRTDLDYLIDVCRAVESAGANMINVPDTVGVMTPPSMSYLISEIKKRIRIPLDVHCHNDFGLAVPNSLAAVEAGAAEVQVTINGLGERAGNADLEQTVMSLEALYGINTGINTKYLKETSELVERFSQITLPPNFPIVGKNAFTHESGIHAHAVINKCTTFEPIKPESVGQKSRLVIGKHTGKHAVKAALESSGYKVNEEQLGEIVNRIKKLFEKHKRISDEDFIAIADDTIGSFSSKKQPIVIEELSVSTSNKMIATSTVVMNVLGEKKIGHGTGIGAVDAVSNAIRSIVPAQLKLKQYNLKAITGGTDALANVLIKIEDEKKREHQAEAVNEDVVIASAYAIIKGLNKAIIRGMENGTYNFRKNPIRTHK